jgi:hypothetical protein
MKPITTSSTPPNQFEKIDTQFKPNDFDRLVYDKGYEVVHENAIKCPCASTSNSSPLTTCQNCSGSGWVFFNSNKTRMVLQSMSLRTKYNDWSKENLGTITVTSRSIDPLGYMDRLTILSSEAIYTQILYPVLFKDQLFSFTVYDLIDIFEVFLFQASNLPLKRLHVGVDYFFEKGKNRVIFDKNLNIENLTVSLRYKHYVQYMIVELSKEFRQSFGLDNLGRDKVNQYPFNGIARRSHYVLDPQDIDGTGIIDNSYLK